MCLSIMVRSFCLVLVILATHCSSGVIKDEDKIKVLQIHVENKLADGIERLSRTLEPLNDSMERLSNTLETLAGHQNALENKLSDAMDRLSFTLADGIKKYTSNMELPTSCMDLMHREELNNGVYTIFTNRSANAKRLYVYCDMTTDGGGWYSKKDSMDRKIFF